MANERIPDDLQTIWRQQPLENKTMPIDEIRMRAARFERRISRRNLREYIGAGVGLAVYLYFYRDFGEPLARAGYALLALGTLFIMWRLYSHGRAARLPEDLGFSASLDFHRRQLVQQRDLLRGIFWWYIAPIIPGLGVFFALAFERAWAHPERLVRSIPMLVIIIGALVWVWRINQTAAACLDRQIAELDRMQEES